MYSTACLFQQPYYRFSKLYFCLHGCHSEKLFAWFRIKMLDPDPRKKKKIINPDLLIGEVEVSTPGP
jgi:hypothetical protein